MLAILLSLVLSASAFPGNASAIMFTEKTQYREWPCKEATNFCVELNTIANFTCDGGLRECEVAYSNILWDDTRNWVITGLGKESWEDSLGNLRTFENVQLTINGTPCVSEELTGARQAMPTNYNNFMYTLMTTVLSCTVPDTP